MAKENNKTSILSNLMHKVQSNIGDDKIINGIVKNINNTINDKLTDNFRHNGSYMTADIYDKVNHEIKLSDFGSLFNSSDINKIINYDTEIDILLKNMPILETAIELKRDNILPGDSLGTDFLNFTNLSSQSNDEQFLDNIEYIKEKYKIVQLIDDTYINMSKYGEVFHHIIEYKSIINNINKDISLNESDGIIAENKSTIKFENSIINFCSDLSVNLAADIISSDAYISESKLKNNDNEVRGAVIRTLKHENVIPIYINETCLGYYYIETFSKDGSDKKYCTCINKNIDSYKKELANTIAKHINTNFIKTHHSYSNDIYNILKYVKHIENADINVIYIKPNDMIHWYFKKSKHTNRGISDLDKALVPAKSWMLLNNAYKFGIITRSHDKRIYYVKPNKSDSNLSTIINKTIAELTRTNSGLVNWSSISSIANFSGMYNDIVAPVNDSGEAAIQFDTLPGQDINVNTDFLESQEKSAVESLEIPYDYVKSASNDIDFATRLNQSHGKFVAHCLKRQMILEPLISKLIMLLYRYEYDDIKILVKLSPPITFRNNTNINVIESQLNIINILSEHWVDIDSNDPTSDQKVRIWKKNYIKNVLSAYVDVPQLEEISKISDIEYVKFKNKLSLDEEE